MKKYKCYDCGKILEDYQVSEKGNYVDNPYTGASEYEGVMVCGFCGSDNIDETEICPSCEAEEADCFHELCDDCTRKFLQDLNGFVKSMAHFYNTEIDNLAEIIGDWYEGR